MTRVAIALGSNLGDRLATLRSAVAALGGLGEVADLSSLYETAPVGGPEQGPYLNAVAILDTRLPPLDLLSALQRIEAQHGRVRSTRWGARTLDLDIVVYDEQQIGSPVLEIPHPRAADRRFVLEPLVEVWPDARVAAGMTAEQALPSTRDQRLFRFEGTWLTDTPTLGSRAVRWVVLQFAVIALFGVALALTGTLPPASPWLWLGALPGALGVAMALWAAGSLGDNLTALPQPRPGATLTAHGPYRVVRHPIYGGLILALAGAATVTGSLAAGLLVVVLAVVFRLKAGQEERALGVAVPGYPEYAASVRWRLLPGI